MMKIPPFQSCLPDGPELSDQERSRLESDYIKGSLNRSSGGLEQYLLDRYQIDLSSRYGNIPIKNPWGKASGQLSMNLNQVRDDLEAGLGFVVLKTVIAENESGNQSMGDWAIKEARMKVEPITAQSGEKGWTVSWKGRGWSLSFEDYLQFFKESLELSRDKQMLVIPSCKYHLPFPGEEHWNLDEYQYTTSKLLDVWNHNSGGNDSPMPLEKDFSPTLAGSDRAKAKEAIIEWLKKVPEYIYLAAGKHQQNRINAGETIKSHSRYPVMLGLKIFNAMFEDQYQLKMLEEIHHSGEYRPDFFIYGNRLFDPNREIDGYTGIAYGGPDLSNRNLNIMESLQKHENKPSHSLSWSATGNIYSGKMAMEYALRGAESFQLHTYFQLPANEYSLKEGSRTSRAMHELYFHPEEGLIAWMVGIGRLLGLNRQPLKFQDLVGKLELLKD